MEVFVGQILFTKKSPLKVCLPFQEEEKKVKKEEMDETLAKNKSRMLGNIKFIGELFKLKVRYCSTNAWKLLQFQMRVSRFQKRVLGFRIQACFKV